jgi:hypothetical protein
VFEVERAAAVSETPTRDEALRDAFQSLAGSAADACSPEDLERVWLAVSGQADAGERRALVGRMATDRALAEAWRVASELWRLAQERASGASASAAPRRRLWPLAAAAVLLLAVAGTWLVVREPPAGEVRDQPGVTIASLLGADATLSRDMFRLRWSAPAGSRYDVRVTTDDLRVIATATDLTAAEFALEPGLLAGLTSGSRVLWQVDAILPGGARVSSPTFAVTVR